MSWLEIPIGSGLGRNQPGDPDMKVLVLKRTLKPRVFPKRSGRVFLFSFLLPQPCFGHLQASSYPPSFPRSFRTSTGRNQGAKSLEDRPRTPTTMKHPWTRLQAPKTDWETIFVHKTCRCTTRPMFRGQMVSLHGLPRNQLQCWANMQVDSQDP